MACFRALFQRSFQSRFLKAVTTLPITETEMAVIKNRYVDIVTSAEIDYSRTTALYIILTNLITIGGVLLVSFLSLEKVEIVSDAASLSFFWICWILSILVTIANKTLYLFALPKKYILNIITLEKYYSEGWSFISGVDRYHSCSDLHHRVQLFCSRVERIKIKSLEALSNIDSNAMDKMSQELGQIRPTAITPPVILHDSSTCPNIVEDDPKNTFTGEFANILAAGTNTTLEQSKENTTLVLRSRTGSELVVQAPKDGQ